MANPKRRHSKSRRDKRRAGWKLKTVNYIKCPSCEALVLPHKACSSCGYYKGETVLIIKEKSKNEEKPSDTEK